ncbi:alpha/beta hydrolase [Desulfospira joergensenii]|uniref:alpha/beta hydrolase n=1 Tax=Desulfospira joergensenii TaxID=53329 RepID=UPI0003B53A79|nr:alpha/beta fold hydrolase [Desulfospira joergensenii]
MKIIGIIFVFGFVLFGVLYLFSRKLLYFPAPLEPGRLDHIRSSLKGVEEISIPVAQGVILHGWFINKDLEHLPVIFYFGGNAEEVSLNLEEYSANLNANVILVNYRGYGKSTGRPKEKDLKADALAVYDAMARQFPLTPSAVIAWGRSLGSSMACFLALERNLGGLILTCPFDSIENVAASYYPAWLVRLVLRDRHRTTDYSGKIQSNTLVLVAGRDEVIPAKNTLALFDSLGCEKERVVMEKAGHNTISDFKEYFESVNRFCSQFKPGPALTRE